MEIPHGLVYRINWGRIAWQRAWPRMAGHFSALRFEPVHEPELLPSRWVTLRPRMSGICGSDIALLRGQSSPYFRPLTSFPAVLGHEILAETADGTRVAVMPTLSCAARRLPPCAHCAVGRGDDCLRRTDPGLGPGLMLGYHSRLPGGWGERMWAPEEQLLVIPESMPDERAVLTEPGAIVLSGLRRLNWAAVRDVLVIGVGTLGLIATAMISELYPAATITVRAKHHYQARLAREMGAHRRGDREAIEHVTGTPLPTLPGYRPHYLRGFDAVVVAVGDGRALADALTWVNPGGQVLLLGGVARTVLDLTPAWARHVTVMGSYGYGDSGVDMSRTVLSLFSVMRQPLESLVTHQFTLGEHKKALNQVLVQRDKVVKAVFRPTSA
ncbi:zinc-dependent alcohol dehydrogenase [Sulfobacillus harzensis]|uniref:Alcohol dehydrogenase catalytic domain-containing protein n=1 Tax=Sulfobacillus harzensis TaxID=2729629 RepID=A0A7Y0L4V0_9FIRM|nr:alcohol dehydrogenase catalytic domain-containing protein [Sulfobacillus harzensis]NMP23354.1 alcohol dehydrogenase catalytic domain-containing protein [Sulfobacillus harzensis]